MGNPVFCNRPVPLQGLFGWSQAVFVPCREQRGKKSPLSGSNCHLCCFLCQSSLCSGCFIPGAELCQAGSVGMSCLCSQEYPGGLTPKLCLKSLQAYVLSQWRHCILLNGCGTHPIPSLQRTDIVIITVLCGTLRNLA